jgi:hypothetical protein
VMSQSAAMAGVAASAPSKLVNMSVFFMSHSFPVWPSYAAIVCYALVELSAAVRSRLTPLPCSGCIS